MLAYSATAAIVNYVLLLADRDETSITIPVVAVINHLVTAKFEISFRPSRSNNTTECITRVATKLFVYYTHSRNSRI